jgi:ABC-2 type transport system ATP-binding protein
MVRASNLYNLRYLANINKIVGVSQIEQVLKSVNLYDVRNKKVRTFSLGMKQRLAICQAVMECPDILLLDEPFNAIDESNLYKVVEILRRQRDDGKLVVVASHGDIPSDNLFSRVIELDSGKIKHDTPS